MKRHRSLIPLSHDHHDGLVVAQGLILGHATAPKSTWPADRRQQVDRLIAFWEADLRKHFEAEEAYLFPIVRARLRDGGTLVAELLTDHEAMRGRMSDLAEDAETDLDERLPAFGELLKEHIRKEEEVLFERMQEELPADELEAIGQTLRTHYRPDDADPACRT